MNLKFVLIPIVVAVGIISLQLIIESNDADFKERQKALELLSNITPIDISQKGIGEIIRFTGDYIFDVLVFSGEEFVNEKGEPTNIFKHLHFVPNPQNTELYREIGVGFEQHNSVFVIPIFTMTAYGEPGFYNYYKEECDTECIEDVPIRYESRPTFESSDNAIKVLRLLGYPYITDIEIDKNPNILELFDKVILLHNEYVTLKEFEAITKHPKVIYLYPNALYAQIETDYEKETISLIRGHNYPNPEIKNGFGWEFDNTHPYEYDTNCENWDFYEVDNGVMLNCYPERIIYKNIELLKAIKDY